MDVSVSNDTWISTFRVDFFSLFFLIARRSWTIKRCILPLNGYLAAVSVFCVWKIQSNLTFSFERAVVRVWSHFLPAFPFLFVCFGTDEIIYRTPKCFRNNYGAKCIVLRDCRGSCDLGSMSVQNNCTVELLIFNFLIFCLTSPHGAL